MRKTENDPICGPSAQFDRAANLDHVKAFADFAEAEFGRINVIVNNAGVMPLSPPSALKIGESAGLVGRKKCPPLFFTSVHSKQPSSGGVALPLDGGFDV